MRERKLNCMKSDSNSDYVSTHKEKYDYKVYIATGFAGSESNISGGKSSLIHSKNNSKFKDNSSSVSESGSFFSK